MSLRITSGHRTTSSWSNAWPTEVRAIIVVVVMSDAPEHTTVTEKMVVVVVTVTLDIMRKHTTKENTHYSKFLWFKDRNT